jgi:hypothetical protein
MKQEGPLNADTVRGGAANGECRVNAAPPNADNHTLHHLYTFTVTLHDAHVGLYRITGRQLGDFLFKILNGSD